MCFRKNVPLFFKAIQIIFLTKDTFYVENDNAIIEENNYYNFLYNIINLFDNKFTNDNSIIYTFDFKEKKIYQRNANNKELERYYNREKEFNLKDIKNFINKVEYVENKNILNITNKIINDNLNNNMESQNNIQKEQINIIIAELNELKLTNSKLEDEI